MANICMILGKSGTGKSTSIKTLNPKETVVINTLQKKLPFKGSTSIYNSENKNLFNVIDWQHTIKLLENLSNNAKHVKNVIIDDMIYIMRKEYFLRARENGYGKTA